MSYVVYDRGLQRTGFRPTRRNAYAAAHGLSGKVATRASHDPQYPFTAYGGTRLHGLGQGAPASAPTGSFITYTGQWQTVAGSFSDNSPSSLLNAVVQLVNQNGLNVAKSNASSAIFAAFGEGFTATLTLQVTGPGFAQASDAASIVNNAVYQVTGQMPTSSLAQVTSVPNVGGGNPSGSGVSNALDPDCLLGLPTDTNGNPCQSSTQSLTAWLEQNVIWIAIVGVGAFAIKEFL